MWRDRIPLGWRRGLGGLRDRLALPAYYLGGRQPWTPGYITHRDGLVRAALKDPARLRIFRDRGQLPDAYGAGCDERVVEYPWVFSRLAPGPGELLDGGAALNFGYLLRTAVLKSRHLTIFTLAPEGEYRRPGLDYVYGDLRRTGRTDSSFDEIVSISTLEHVGMDNTMLYTADLTRREGGTGDYKLVVAEYRRLLKPGGRVLITVPYGAYALMGWQQQFDAEMVGQVIETFGGQRATVSYYHYHAGGWQISNADECRAAEYHDVHRGAGPAADGAAAARAVACLELVK